MKLTRRSRCFSSCGLATCDPSQSRPAHVKQRRLFRSASTTPFPLMVRELLLLTNDSFFVVLFLVSLSRTSRKRSHLSFAAGCNPCHVGPLCLLARSFQGTLHRKACFQLLSLGTHLQRRVCCGSQRAQSRTCSLRPTFFNEFVGAHLAAGANLQDNGEERPCQAPARGGWSSHSAASRLSGKTLAHIALSMAGRHVLSEKRPLPIPRRNCQPQERSSRWLLTVRAMRRKGQDAGFLLVLQAGDEKGDSHIRDACPLHCAIEPRGATRKHCR